jgi:hypothetical protein
LTVTEPEANAGRRSIEMARSIRLYTSAQFEEMKTLVDRLAEQALPGVERDKLTTFQADVAQTIREDRRRAAGAAHLSTTSN